MGNHEKRKHITIAFYEKTEEQKKRYISYMRNSIRKGQDKILQSMSSVVEKHLKKYHADFYVHMMCLLI
ncbi:hypothetical protein ACA29_03070 [Lederbergia galactosidilytica]|uniref:Uncharacterized protein n=1 Tax=Lederbergia galactosidilytica TaxID=217031 RepID=A0A0Q9YAG6_9BACI|nr:hypothetical protein ACA29_03070 [Lederbergia galactosidilytica]